MNCPQCNSKLAARQVYCSSKCRQAAYRARAGSPEKRNGLPPLPDSVPNVTGALSDGVGRRVMLWVDDPLIGSGERPFVVTAIGASRVRLFSCAALVQIEVDRRVFDDHAEFDESDPAALLALLRRNVATAERHRLEYHRDAARAVERLLDFLREPQVGDPWRFAA